MTVLPFGHDFRGFSGRGTPVPPRRQYNRASRAPKREDGDLSLSEESGNRWESASRQRVASPFRTPFPGLEGPPGKEGFTAGEVRPTVGVAFLDAEDIRSSPSESDSSGENLMRRLAAVFAAFPLIGVGG